MNRPVMLLAGVLVAGCGGGDEGGAQRAELTAEWVGADTGGINVSPKVTWCASDTLLTVLGMKGDGGLGLAILTTAGPDPGTYPVRDPSTDTTRIRPGAYLAARWVGDKAVPAYQGDSGSVTLTNEATGLSGTFSARLRGVNTTDTIRMTGHFGGTRPGACPADTAASR